MRPDGIGLEHHSDVSLFRLKLKPACAVKDHGVADMD
jgi:hypothetical protein